MSSWTDRVRSVFFEKVEEDVDGLPETLPQSTSRPTASPASRVSPLNRAAAPRVALPPAPPPPPPVMEEIPAAIKAVVDQQFSDAASPALQAWYDVNEEFANTIPDPTMRMTVVLSTLKRLNLNPTAVYTDIEECREKLAALTVQIQGAKEAELKAKVLDIENHATLCEQKAADMELEIAAIRKQATELSAQAQAARSDIEQNHASSLRYIDELMQNLDEVAQEVHAASPTTPFPSARSKVRS